MREIITLEMTLDHVHYIMRESGVRPDCIVQGWVRAVMRFTIGIPRPTCTDSLMACVLRSYVGRGPF